MADSEVGMLIRSLRSDDATVSRNAACRLKEIYGSSELAASDGASPSEGQKRLESLWAQNRWTRPPPDGRATIHVAGFGFYPTGPPKPKPAPDPAKAKAKARWKMVAKFLRPGGGAADAGVDEEVQAVSVRRHSSFNLLPVIKSEAAAREGDEEAIYEWVHYSLEPVSPGTGPVAVRQRSKGAVTLKDMRDSFATGVDNTGNVCLWPAEEVMAHYILSRASEFEGKNICELGAGVGLCGLAMARALKTNSLLLTDGNAQVVDTLQRALEHNRKEGLSSPETTTRLLVWDRKLTTLEVPRAGSFDFVVAADCLFFKDYHIDLLHTIKTLLSASGKCLLFAPLRGTTLETFCTLAAKDFDIVREERYDMDVWEAHVMACEAAGVSPSTSSKPPTPSKPPTGFIMACVPCTPEPASTPTAITSSRIPPHTLTSTSAPASTSPASAPAASSSAAAAAAPSGSAGAYDPAIHYPLLLTLTKKKVAVAPPPWATMSHRGGSSCFCCKGKKTNPAFF